MLSRPAPNTTAATHKAFDVYLLAGAVREAMAAASTGNADDKARNAKLNGAFLTAYELTLQSAG